MVSKRRWFTLWMVVALAALVASCGKDEAPANDLEDSIKKAIDYLHAEYDPQFGLLRESPETEPDRYWLANDNWLAVQALTAAGDEALAKLVMQSIVRYGGAQHGIIEALAGTPIAWPPRAPHNVKIVPHIVREERTGEEMLDWYDYTDLRLYGALHARQTGDLDEAKALYQATLADFKADGKGFADEAFSGRYATYKLALALIVGLELQEPVDPSLLRALLDKQQASGGFVTLYTADHPVGDTNTETTSYALLALAKLQQCLGAELCTIASTKD